MGINCTFVSQTGANGPATTRSPHGIQWHLVDTSHGGALARSARRVRSLANGVAVVQPVEPRWNAGGSRKPSAGITGRCRPDQRRIVVCGWHGGSRGSLCRRGWKKNDPNEATDHALGRSRGGFSCKIHLLCDAHGHPLHFHLTAGQAHESTGLKPLLIGADEQLLNHDGQPFAWPLQLAGDKGYRAAWIDEYLLSLNIDPVIPSKENEDRDARPVAFDREAYRDRNIIERLIGWLKESRRIFSRFEKTAINFGGMIRMAFIQHMLRRIWRT